MPAKGDGAARRSRSPRRRRFHRSSGDDVTAAALRLLRRRHGSFPSQGQFVRAVRGHLRDDDPIASIGGRRLRRLLLETPGVRIDIEFAERKTAASATDCPVCGGTVRPIGNRTLDGSSVVLGYRCPRCGYWTHRRRRVPVRYTFRAASISEAGGRGSTASTSRPSA